MASVTSGALIRELLPNRPVTIMERSWFRLLSVGVLHKQEKVNFGMAEVPTKIGFLRLLVGIPIFFLQL